MLFAAMGLFAQTNEEVFREYQFNFNLPGARANGMGGAFIGVADDATSSFTNPAGLAYLTETAITLDYRSQHIKGQTGTIEGFFNTTFEQEARQLDAAAFFSINFNYKGWYFGLYQHQFANDTQSRNFVSRSFEAGVERIEGREVSLDLEGNTIGLGIARRFGRFKAGLTINHMTLDVNTNYERLGYTFSPEISTVAYNSQIQDSNERWGYTLGVLSEIGTNLSWGAVWRANPKFDLTESVLGTIDGQPILSNDQQGVPFVVPDVLGTGIRYKPRPDLSLLLDWQQIYYSQILKDGFVIVESIPPDFKEFYRIDDTQEIHAGLEWLIPAKTSVWVARAGYYTNPQHTVEYTGPNEATADRFAQVGVKNQDHVTVGAGWVFRNAFEIDLSANFWDGGRELTASFIWRKK